MTKRHPRAGSVWPPAGTPVRPTQNREHVPFLDLSSRSGYTVLGNSQRTEALHRGLQARSVNTEAAAGRPDGAEQSGPRPRDM